MFSSPVSIRLSSGTSRTVAPRRMSSTTRMPMSILLTRSAFGVSAGLDRIGQMVVQAGRRLAGKFAEAQHHAELVGLDAEEAGHAPQHQRGERDQREAARRPGCRRAGRCADRSWLRRRSSSRSGWLGPGDDCVPPAPRAARAATAAPRIAPWASALIVPRHDILLGYRRAGPPGHLDAGPGQTTCAFRTVRCGQLIGDARAPCNAIRPREARVAGGFGSPPSSPHIGCKAEAGFVLRPAGWLSRETSRQVSHQSAETTRRRAAASGHG